MRSHRARWPLATRSVTLVVALLVAATSYGVLTATTKVSRLSVRGTINETAASTAYDILVRPKGSRLPVEEATGRIQPDILTPGAGGISMEQWRRIEALPGVDVAAPVALVGWVVLHDRVPIDLASLASITEPVLLRRSTTWVYDNGVSTVKQYPVLIYVTPNPVRIVFPDISDPAKPIEPARWLETLPDGRTRSFPVGDASGRETIDAGPPSVSVLSTRTLRTDPTGAASVAVPFPFLLAAVDPQAEARLSTLDGAIVDGDYLPTTVPEKRVFAFADGAPDPRQPVPVVVADHPMGSLAAQVTVERVRGLDPGRLADARTADAEVARLAAAPGVPVTRTSVSQEDAYRTLLRDMATATSDGEYYARAVSMIHRTTALAVADRGSVLVPEKRSTNLIGWGNESLPHDTAESLVPPGGDDTAFREMTAFGAYPDHWPPALVRQGVFDPAKVPGTTSLGRLPLGIFSFAPTTGADDASTKALGDRPWSPAATIRGYVTSPPLMLTSLQAAAVFADKSVWATPGPAGLPMDGITPLSATPLTAVRVRVKGVDTLGPLDRERVRVVAEDIARETGLTVDITLGSSPGPVTARVAAGIHGRPEVQVNQLWVTKGVAVALISSIDRTSQLLSWVVLGVSGLVVANAVFAGVRARRREIGLARALGWPGRTVLAHIIGPVLAVAVVTGLVGASLALVVRSALGLGGWDGASLGDVLVAVPAAVLVGVVAALPPALLATRIPPLAALRAPGALRPRAAPKGWRRPRLVRSPGALSLRATLSAWGRSLAAVAGVGVASAALGALAAIQAEFHGRAVGTLLGDAVAIQVRSSDVAAVVITAVLAGTGVFHLTRTEMRERAVEVATMRAVGWTDSAVVRTLVLQALVVAGVGAAGGAALATGFLRSTFGALTPAMVSGLVLAVVAAVALAGCAALVAMWGHRRRSVGQALARD